MHFDAISPEFALAFVALLLLVVVAFPLFDLVSDWRADRKRRRINRPER